VALYAIALNERFKPLIPAKAEPIRSRVPMRRFRYDAKHDILKYPNGRILRPTRTIKHGRFFYQKAKDCSSCPLKADCLSGGRVNKAVVVGDDYPALLRARRRSERWTKEDNQRHRWRFEGFMGRQRLGMDLTGRCNRGLGNMRIQAYLTAAVINLKRLWLISLFGSTSCLRRLVKLGNEQHEQGSVIPEGWGRQAALGNNFFQRPPGTAASLTAITNWGPPILSSRISGRR
jgi:Transposase DDE domain